MIDRKMRLSCLLAALVCALAAPGCGPDGPESGTTGDVPVHVRVRQSLTVGVVELSRITLLVNAAVVDPLTGLLAPGPTAFARDLVPNGREWTSRLDLVQGDYFLRAEAFAGATSVGTTASLPVRIAGGTTPLVDLLLSIADPGDAFSNHAPIFDLVHVSTAWALPGSEVVITVIASDGDGDALTLVPTNLGCTAGSSAIDESPVPLTTGLPHLLRWTAPDVPAECNLQLDLRDARGASLLAFVPLSVGAMPRLLEARFNLLAAPTLTALTMQPGPLDPLTGLTPVRLAATGMASDGSTDLAYSWTFDPTACTGNFAPASASQTTFYLQSFSGSRECALIVRATAGDGAYVEGVAWLQPPPVVRYRPALWLEYQSATALNPNQQLELRVRSVVKNPIATYQWTAPPGSAVVVDADTSTLTWSAAMFSVPCEGANPSAQIEVTVTDPVWNETSQPVVVSVGIHKNACIRR